MNFASAWGVSDGIPIIQRSLRPPASLIDSRQVEPAAPAQGRLCCAQVDQVTSTTIPIVAALIAASLPRLGMLNGVTGRFTIYP